MNQYIIEIYKCDDTVDESLFRGLCAADAWIHANELCKGYGDNLDFVNVYQITHIKAV